MTTLLQINTVINSGSTGRIAEEIGQIAIQKGWNSYIAFGRNDRSSSSKKIKIGTRKDIILHGIYTRIYDKHGFGSKKATIDFIKKIDEIYPDIIHLHNIHGYYINIEILFNYLSKLNKPIVWTLHDCWAFTGHCSYFDFVGCEKWKTGCSSCPQKKMYPSSYLFDNSEHNYLLKKELFNSINNLTIVPVSKWLEELVKQSFLKQNNVHQIYNGIDIKKFKPVKSNVKNKYKLLSNKFIILGVASVWEERKGLTDFIKLSRLLDAKFQIVLIGLNKKQLKDLPENILGIRRTENIEELSEWYSAADVFVNPTWEDNFPTTNLEALACGAPVITYNTGGSPESIDNKTGIIVEKGNIKELLQAINTVKNNGKMYYSKYCRERAVKHYNKDDRFNEYLKLYDSLV